MSVRDVSNALKHVHNSIDVDTQWHRATDGLARMSDLERAQVWASLSSHTLSMDERTAPVAFSQLKTLYKAALKKGVKKDELPQQCCGGCSTGPVEMHANDDSLKLLNEYKQCLETYQGFLTPLVDLRREGRDQIVMIVQEVIGNSALLADMKKQIQDTLDKTVKDLARQADMMELKTVLTSIQTEKAKETTLGKINEILAAMQGRMDMLTSKVGNSNLGVLAEQVLTGNTRIQTLETSHKKLSEEIDKLFSSIRTHTTETRKLQTEFVASNQNIADMTNMFTNLNQSVDVLTRERTALASEITKLADASSGSMDEIRTRLGLVETSARSIDDIATRLRQVESSYATLENVKEFVERLDIEERQTHDTSEPAGTRANGSKPPPVPPYAQNARPGKGGLSDIARQRGVPPVNREGSTSNSPPRRPPFRAQMFNLSPTSPASSPSAPGSP